METCPCGATYSGDGFSAINFRKAHADCREAWAEAQRATAAVVDNGGPDVSGDPR